MHPLLLLIPGVLFVRHKRKQQVRETRGSGDPKPVDQGIFAGASDLQAPPNNLLVEQDTSKRDVTIAEFLGTLEAQPRSVTQLTPKGTFEDDDISVLPVVNALQRCCPG